MRSICIWGALASAVFVLAACDQTSVAPGKRDPTPIVEDIEPTPEPATVEEPHVEERRLALLIGNEDYPDEVGKLARPHTDVRVIREALIASGFRAEDIVTVGDGDRTEMMDGVKAFINRLDAAGRGGVGFVYYSGHGGSVSDEGRMKGYFLPVGTVPASRSDVVVDGVIIDQLFSLFSNLKAKAIFFIADACRNAAAVPGSDESSSASQAFDGVTRGMTRARTGQNLLAVYATREGDVAPDNGVFADELARNLVKKGVKASDVFWDTLSGVSSKGNPRGTVEPGLAGNFCFQPCDLEEPVGPKESDAAAWKAAEAANSVEAFTYFITQHPASAHVIEASQRLQALATAPSSGPAPAPSTSKSVLFASARQKDMCSAFSMIGKEDWAKQFHRPPNAGTWHVYVESLTATGTLTQAMAARDAWNRRFPNLEFALVSTIAADHNSNQQFAVVLAQGLPTFKDADEVANFAKSCGIRADAYIYKQKT
jgi:uncharacterized caspase-like protein